MNADLLLDPVELDVLWAELGLGELPFPVEPRAYGATLAERDRLRGAGRERLRRRGLVERSGVHKDVARLLRALGRSTSTVSVLGVAPGCATGTAVVATDGSVGVLACPVPDGLWLRPIRPTALADAAIGRLADVPPGPGRAMNLPIPGSHGPALRTVTPDPPIGGGQLRVTLTGRQRPGAVVSWFDTHRGRYLAVQSSPGWLTVTPADRTALHRRVTHLLAC